jgi:hypothetical protein
MKLGLAPETGSRENWQWNLLDPKDGCTIATAHRAVCSKLHTFRGSQENALEHPKRLGNRQFSRVSNMKQFS